jgi:hypothetical protein
MFSVAPGTRASTSGGPGGVELRDVGIEQDADRDGVAMALSFGSAQI